MEPKKYESPIHQSTQKCYWKNMLSPIINDIENFANTERILDQEATKKRKKNNLINIKLPINYDLEKNKLDSSINNLQKYLNGSSHIQNNISSNMAENKEENLSNNENIKTSNTHIPLNLLYKKNLIKSQDNTKRGSIEKKFKNNLIVYKKRQSYCKLSRKNKHKEAKNNNNIDKSDLSLSLIKMSCSTYGNEFADNSISIKEINSMMTCNNNKNKKIKIENNSKGLLNTNQQPIIINDSNCHNFYNSFYLKEGYMDRKNHFFGNFDNNNIDAKNSKILKIETKLYKNAVVISMRHLQKFCRLRLFNIFENFFNILKNHQNKKSNNVYHKKTSSNTKKCQYFSPSNKNYPKISNFRYCCTENNENNLYKSQVAKGRKTYGKYSKNHRSINRDFNELNNIYIKKTTKHKSKEPMKLIYIDEKITNDQKNLLFRSTNNKYFTLRKESSEEKQKEENMKNNNENSMSYITGDKKINIYIHIIPNMIKNTNIIKYENLKIISNENICIPSKNSIKKLRLKAKVFHKIIKYLRRKIRYLHLLNIITLLKRKYFKYFLSTLNDIKKVNNISLVRYNSNKSFFSMQESEGKFSDSKSLKNQRCLSSSMYKNRTHVVRITKIKVIESTINEIIPKAISKDNKKLYNGKKITKKKIEKENEYNFRKKFLLKKFVINKKNMVKKYFENWLNEIKIDSNKNNTNNDNNPDKDININNSNFGSKIKNEENFPEITNESCNIMNSNENKRFKKNFILLFRTELILFAFKCKQLNNNSQLDSED